MGHKLHSLFWIEKDWFFPSHSDQLTFLASGIKLDMVYLPYPTDLMSHWLNFPLRSKCQVATDATDQIFSHLHRRPWADCLPESTIRGPIAAGSAGMAFSNWSSGGYFG